MRAELFERFMHAHDVVGRRRVALGERAGERDDEDVAAAALGLPLAREVDDHRSHRAARVGEKAALLGRTHLDAGDAQVGLVHERRGVEQGLAAAAAQAGAGQHAQLPVRLRG